MPLEFHDFRRTIHIGFTSLLLQYLTTKQFDFNRGQVKQKIITSEMGVSKSVFKKPVLLDASKVIVITGCDHGLG